jgi:hypothetical protein
VADDVKFYPKGEIALGGTLNEITRVNIRSASGTRLKHSIAKTPSGYVRGNREVSVSFSMEMPEGGQERDWFADWLSGSKKVAAVKLPGETRILNIVVSEESVSMSPEDAVQREISAVGWWSKGST